MSQNPYDPFGQIAAQQAEYIRQQYAAQQSAGLAQQMSRLANRGAPQDPQPNPVLLLLEDV